MAEEPALTVRNVLPITLDQLRQAMPLCTAIRATAFLDPLNEAMERFEINTPLRVATFLATLAHESGSFRYMSELADGAAYEDRADLGNDLPEAKLWPADGKAGPWFKGRGPIQTTGYLNYRAAGQALYSDPERFLAHPELLAGPHDGCLSSALYWKREGCNEVADTGNFLGTQQIVNMGKGRLGSTRTPIGWKDREDRFKQAQAALGLEQGGGNGPTQVA